MLLGFSDIGSWPALRALCEEFGCDVEILRSERRQQNQPVEFQLLEVLGLGVVDVASARRCAPPCGPAAISRGCTPASATCWRYADRVELAAGEVLFAKATRRSRCTSWSRGPSRCSSTGSDGRELVLAQARAGQGARRAGGARDRRAPAGDRARGGARRRSCASIARRSRTTRPATARCTSGCTRSRRATRATARCAAPRSARCCDPDPDAMQRTVPAGEVLFRQGDEADRVYLIAAGTAAVYKERGERRELIGRVTEGRCVGELALVRKARRSATVVAETELRLVEVDGDRFLDLLESSPALREHMQALERVYRLPARGVITQHTGRVEGEDALTTLYHLADGRRFVASRVVARDLYHLERVEPRGDPAAARDARRRASSRWTTTARSSPSRQRATGRTSRPRTSWRSTASRSPPRTWRRFERTGELQARAAPAGPFGGPRSGGDPLQLRAGHERGRRQGDPRRLRDARRPAARARLRLGLRRLRPAPGASGWPRRRGRRSRSSRRSTSPSRCARFGCCRRPAGRGAGGPASTSSSPRTSTATRSSGATRCRARPATPSTRSRSSASSSGASRTGSSTSACRASGCASPSRAARRRGSSATSRRCASWRASGSRRSSRPAARSATPRRPRRSTSTSRSAARTTSPTSTSCAARDGVTIAVRETATDGRLTAAEVRELVALHPGARVYVCGPPGYLRDVVAVPAHGGRPDRPHPRRGLRARGRPAERARRRSPRRPARPPGLLDGTSDYEIFVRTAELLAIQVSAEDWAHPDELLFQIVHQASELWLKLAVSELARAAEHLRAGERRAGAAAAAPRDRVHEAHDGRAGHARADVAVGVPGRAARARPGLGLRLARLLRRARRLAAARRALRTGCARPPACRCSRSTRAGASSRTSTSSPSCSSSGTSAARCGACAT